MGYMKELRKVVGSRPLIMVGACVIIINEKNEMLLQHRKDNGCWGLIGGSMELGESLEQVAYREMFEETGLKAQQLTLLHNPHGDEVHLVVAAYECKDFSGELKHDEEEAFAIRFFPMEQLPTDLNLVDVPVIQDYLKRV
ncbi:NUDIX domain-containing protein [Metasolibacillus meyeri]|uniref:NUDIX domain-containing protein n=1 Tax=Metasolibacillus meyeri TaxID=1071052 RepID=A0AAW9NY47_9BACL|nr:NUDIX domain-containing protein [Metasolibacillus meyeri]MEC1179800.1 NUDIX domain-containing protein [Metasolibacillus meyeri]